MASSSDSDSDIHVDDRQASPASAATSTLGVKGRYASDGEVVRPRRHSLSPDDLTPDYVSNHPLKTSPGYSTDTSHVVSRRSNVSPRPLRKLPDGDVVQMVVTPPPGETEAPVHFSPSSEVFPTGDRPNPAAMKEEDLAVAPVQHTVHGLPTASVQPLQDPPHDNVAFARSKSVRSGRHMRHRGSYREPTAATRARQHSVDEVSGFLDLSSSKPASMPAVVHPIKVR